MPKTSKKVPPTAEVGLTLLYINFKGVIPAKAGIQLRNTGFRVKPGMTIKGKGFMTHCTGNFMSWTSEN
jgi:hypothetical protein